MRVWSHTRPRLSLPIGCCRPRPRGHWLGRGRVSRARPGAMAAERGLELVRELHRAAGGHLPPFRVSAGTGPGNTGTGPAGGRPALTARVRCCRRRRCGRRWRRCGRCTSGTRRMCELGSCSRHSAGGAPRPPALLLLLIPQVRSEGGTDGPDFPYPVPALLPAAEPAVPPGLPVSAASLGPSRPAQGPRGQRVDSGPGQQGGCAAASPCVPC